MLDALKESEIIYEAVGRIGSYAGLLYASDTANADYQNLEQRVEQRSTAEDQIMHRDQKPAFTLQNRLLETLH